MRIQYINKFKEYNSLSKSLKKYLLLFKNLFLISILYLIILFLYGLIRNTVANTQTIILSLIAIIISFLFIFKEKMIKIFLLFKELTFLFEKKMVFSAPEEDKDFKDITEVYNKTTELKPEDGYVYYYQCGIQSFNSKKYEDAIFFFTKVIEYKSDFARAYYYLGEIYKILKEYKKAIINWEKAIEINPEYLKKLDKFIKEIEGKNK